MLNSPLNTGKQRQHNQPTSLSGGFFPPFFLVTLPVRSWDCSANEHVEEFLGHFGRVQSRTAIYLQRQRQHPLEDRHYSAGGRKWSNRVTHRCFSGVGRQGFINGSFRWKKWMNLVCSSISLAAPGLSTCSVDFEMAVNSHVRTSLTNTHV